MCVDRAVFEVMGRLSRPFISASVRVVGILSISLFLIPLQLFVHGFGFWSGFALLMTLTFYIDSAIIN